MSKKKETLPAGLLEEDLALAPSDDSLSLVAALAEEQLRLESEVADLTEQLKTKNKELLKISDEELPAAITNAGLEEFKLANGTKITVKKDMSVSISEAKRPFVLSWLRKKGFDDIIKREITVSLPKGTDDKLVEKLRLGLQKLKVDFGESENAATATVKALLKEQLAKGVKLDLSKFGAYPYKRAIITLPKAQ